MFSFHKPRIYRSASGCCICRAKSSSSRFTDSRRYEGDFYACFKLGECRTGDICNACVLLVKRWKKLPKGSQRNWHHVVDARAGHGSKPISKINKVKKPVGGIGISKIKPPGMELDKMRNAMKKHMSPSESYISSLGRAREHSPSGCSDDVQMDCISSESGSYHSSLAASPTPSEIGDDDVSYENSARPKRVKTSKEAGAINGRPISQLVTSTNGTNKMGRGRDISHKARRNSDASHSSFLDLSFWKREKTCCGIIFKGPCGEVLLDRRFLSPCFLRTPCGHTQVQEKVVIQCLNKSESSASVPELEERCPLGIRKELAIPTDCNSVDSGYDDSSNSTTDSFKPLQTPGGGIACGAAKTPDSMPTNLRNSSSTSPSSSSTTEESPRVSSTTVEILSPPTLQQCGVVPTIVSN